MYLAKVPPAQKLSSSGWAKTPRMRFECCIASILFIGDLSFLFSFKHVGCYVRTKGDRATSIPGATQFGKRAFPCEQAPDTRGVNTAQIRKGQNKSRHVPMRFWARSKRMTEPV